MKVFILKNNFKSGLQIVERVANKNINFPILENVLISTEKNFLILTTTDLETAIKCWILAKIEIEGSVALPAKFLSNYINSLEPDKICLKEEGNFLNIESKNFQTKIKKTTTEDFPLFPSFDEKNSIQINTIPFVEGLKQIIEITSPSQTKPEISGVFLDFSPDTLKLVATDSFRLAEKTLFFEKKEKQKTAFIIPQKTARELVNIFSEKKGKLIIYFTKNQVVFEFLVDEITQPRIQIFSRLIEGDYPNYQEIIPQKHSTQITVPRPTFLNQVKTAGLFCGKINEVKLKINPKQKTIEVFSQSPDLGENKSSFSGEVKGEAVEVSFNWRFLAEGLSNIKSREVVFELSGEEGPAILKPVDDQSYFYVIMPIKAT
ncbi:MAG TPA: DNA polymerase III subunit beta [Candidatus Nealsonbacteria bacterium]|uniref:Beta sliding clamp n=1 Tax=marine sediment metagenome TaxID=412755 RepID=A0A0F9UZE2_9ZZZZ|nr:DNA polymerase III subunit beta [Candidatus Nealsonbacteria bacterium]HEB46259.1 DNA polymerase III subunit beta [Candidatus Nealsonbacteria bacterium]